MAHLVAKKELFEQQPATEQHCCVAIRQDTRTAKLGYNKCDCGTVSESGDDAVIYANKYYDTTDTHFHTAFEISCTILRCNLTTDSSGRYEPTQPFQHR